MAAWLIITGSGLDDWIYWRLLLQSLLITISYNNSQSIYCRGLTAFCFSCLSSLSTSELSYWIELNSVTELAQCWVEFYITTDGQPASLSWNKAPIWGLRPDFDYCQTFAGLLMWGVLSDERTDLLFAIAAGPCQRNLSLVRVPWDSRLHFTVSDSRLPFLSPPTTRRVTVEVFDPASTRVWLNVLTCPPFITSGRTE
jgi:hypothetical protein